SRACSISRSRRCAAIGARRARSSMNASVDVDAGSIAAMRLFDRFLDADEAERAQLLAHLAASEPDVHRRLLELIAADAAAERDRFLDVDALHDAATNAISEPPRDLAGEQLGAWRLVRLLGTGGAGQVWLA